MGEDPGILSCAKSQVWTPDDFNRFIQQGNEKTNLTLLSPFPVWVYQPTPNDSISLKVSNITKYIFYIIGIKQNNNENIGTMDKSKVPRA